MTKKLSQALWAAAVLALVAAGIYYARSNWRAGDRRDSLTAGASKNTSQVTQSERSSAPAQPENQPEPSVPTALSGAVLVPEAQPAPRVGGTRAATIPSAYARHNAVTAEHQAWLKRNQFPDDARVDLLMAMDLNSLRVLVAKGDLAAQTELAYRLGRDAGTQGEAAELFKDAIVKGSKEALVRTAEFMESASNANRLCANAAQVNAYLQVAAMLGDAGAVGKYVMCAQTLTPEQQGYSLALAAKIFATLNQEALRRTGRPLQVDPHPMTMTDALLHQLLNAGKEGEGTEPEERGG